MNDTTSSLREALRDLAEDAMPADLHDRVLHSARRRHRRRMAFGSLGAAVIVGVVAVPMLMQDRVPAPATTAASTTAAPAPITTAAPAPTTTPSDLVALSADRVRIVDPSAGDRSELSGVEKLIDGDPATAWGTQEYTSPDFGALKPGLGILLDLGSARQVIAADVEFTSPGATVELRGGDGDPGAVPAGDDTIVRSYRLIGQRRTDAATSTILPGSARPVRYLLLWITRLPRVDQGPGQSSPRFALEVNQIRVRAR
ncbi:MAG TPA: hypothetical protein VF755_07610 [Catenuloplanes sp.]|jgi:hypothetical protein